LHLQWIQGYLDTTELKINGKGIYALPRPSAFWIAQRWQGIIVRVWRSRRSRATGRKCHIREVNPIESPGGRMELDSTAEDQDN
jgi:hypothetical protein